jgi:hypothetical protein
VKKKSNNQAPESVPAISKRLLSICSNQIKKSNGLRGKWRKNEREVEIKY